MEWLTGLRTAIDYMEEHLLDNISAEDVAGAVYLSPFYFQKCFKIVTGYTIGEYLRNRRLYLSALEVLAGNVPGEGRRGKGGGGCGERRVIDLHTNTVTILRRASPGHSPVFTACPPCSFDSILIRSRYFFP